MIGRTERESCELIVSIFMFNTECMAPFTRQFSGFRGLTNLEPFFAMETKPPSWH
uniref:Uncharacterized protein n=1 Tax=Triticum urartu TaxID=4572 RepID=A0A8R7V817_TRIUA